MLVAFVECLKTHIERIAVDNCMKIASTKQLANWPVIVCNKLRWTHKTMSANKQTHSGSHLKSPYLRPCDFRFFPSKAVKHGLTFNISTHPLHMKLKAQKPFLVKGSISYHNPTGVKISLASNMHTIITRGNLLWSTSAPMLVETFAAMSLKNPNAFPPSFSLPLSWLCLLASS